jgi:hypothetical protein
MGSAFLLGTMAVMFAALPSTAGAAPKLRCTGAPFSFTDLQTTQFVRAGNHLNAEWMGLGMTTLDCADGSILAIDVWEHASVAVGSGAPGTGANGDGRLIGRVQLGVRIPDGGTVIIGGYMHGVGDGCENGLCVVNAEVRANTRGGGKLLMVQRVTIDLSTRMVTHIDVVNIAIELTSAG